MLNFSLRCKKAWWSVLGLCLGLMNAPVFSATYSTLFAFDLHLTAAGVVEGTGSQQGYLFGTTYDTTLSYGGSIYKVALGGGAPQTVYQLQSTDGYNPQATLLASTDGYLYGTTHYGPRIGASTSVGTGTIFRVGQDGTGFTTLHTFASAYGSNSSLNADGFYPDHALIESGAYLYGVTTAGGLYGSGTVFRIRKTDGVLDVLHHFAAVDSSGVNSTGEGASPSSSLTIASDERLYGVTVAGGANLRTNSDSTTVGTGTIYSLNLDGSDFQTVYQFSALDGTQELPINGDGAQPNGGLLEVSPGMLMGTTNIGGTPTDPTIAGYGTIFSFDIATSELTTLYNFDSNTGASPKGKLALDLDRTRAYGVTTSGSSSYGAIFGINIDGSDFSVEHALTFAEGSVPTGGLTLASNGDLFGTVSYGNACTATSSSGYGAVFRYSVATNASSSGYASCTASSDSGGGAFSAGFLCVLSMLGLAPPVRRRLFGLR